VPHTFVLPEENCEAMQHAKAMQHASSTMPAPGGMWIAKPQGGFQGKGIKVFSELEAAVQQNRRSRVVQQYIEPLLLGGYKFDLRLYVLITSLCPLEAHYYEHGYARFCMHRYNTSNLDNRYAHLTNITVQQQRDGGCKDDGQDQNYVRVEAVWKELATKGVDVQSVQASVKEALRLVLLSTSEAVAQKREEKARRKKEKESKADKAHPGEEKERAGVDGHGERGKREGILQGGERDRVWSWQFGGDSAEYDGCKHFQVIGFTTCSCTIHSCTICSCTIHSCTTCSYTVLYCTILCCTSRS
jgi:hypothetical protein